MDLTKAKIQSKTNLADFAPWLGQMCRDHPESQPVVIGGHASNYWLSRYRQSHSPLERWQPKAGRDLDLLISPKIVAEELMKDPTYEPAATFLQDLLFFSARRFLLRQRLTPISVWFILRAGKINIAHANGRNAIQVDLFAHTLGYHPEYVRKRAVAASLEGGEFLVADPVQCLWNFLANAGTLNQTQGDEGPRRRIDHERTVLLYHVCFAYFRDLAEKVREGDGEAGRQLASALGDLAHFLKTNIARDLAPVLGLDWSRILPPDVRDLDGHGIRGFAAKVAAAGSLSPRRKGLFRRHYPKPAPTFSPENLSKTNG